MILPLNKALSEEGGTFVLKGNLAPNGCVVKPAAADHRLMRHTGPAVVFENYPDLKARLNRDDLNVTPDSVLVLKNAGPLGGPGFPEWGMLPIPNKLLQQGVRDMVRISDARMSGTSYGMCILHVSPEATWVGRSPWYKMVTSIELDVPARQLQLHVSEAELLPSAGRSGRSPQPRYDAVTGKCSRSISVKQTRAATSIFSSTALRCRSRKFTDDQVEALGYV